MGHFIRLPRCAQFAFTGPDIEGLPDGDAEINADIRPSTFFDAATVHLLTTATLNQLQSLTPTSRFETRRFRPNLVIQPVNQE